MTTYTLEEGWPDERNLSKGDYCITNFAWIFYSGILLCLKRIYFVIMFNINKGPLWSWSHGSWNYNYLCNQCLSPLMMWVNPAHGQVYSLQHYVCLTVTCGRSVVFSGYSGFFHQLDWSPWYSWNIFESGVKHHNRNP
jgi:hypothetical protein